MLSEFGRCPKEVFDPVLKTGQLDILQTYSCNDCGECTVVCPHELPVREAFMEARKDFVKANLGEPPLSGHRPVKIHQALGFYSMYTTKVCGGKKNDSSN